MSFSEKIQNIKLLFLFYLNVLIKTLKYDLYFKIITKFKTLFNTKKMSQTSKQKIYWIGEHSYQLFKNTDQLILNNFNNQILLYSRINSKEVTSHEIIYLDEFFPMKERNYILSDLQKPISLYLKDKKIPYDKGLIIGDASEILVQSLVTVGTFEISDFNKINEDITDFELVHKIENIEEFNKIDVSGFSILFLEEAIPFKDTIEKAHLYKEKATKTFNYVIVQKEGGFELNEFLYHLENGIVDAVSKSIGVEFYKKQD